MKKFILLVISILFVFGCTTNKKEISKQTEVIQAFFIANNNIYAVGDLNSYQFSSSKSEDVQHFINFLNSKEIVKITKLKHSYLLNLIAKNWLKKR